MSSIAAAGSNVSIALIHYPVYDKNRQIVATALTNLDLHDIARAARTFGLFRYYVVTPVSEQQSLAKRITSHWQDGYGATYNPKRKEALDMVRVASSLDEVLADQEKEFGRPARVVATGAGINSGCTSCADFAGSLADLEQPNLILFGTGWGLTEELFAWADVVLEPIRGAGSYNHLSVRSAAAIILDRLLGRAA